jgi:hypothetical protein
MIDFCLGGDVGSVTVSSYGIDVSSTSRAWLGDLVGGVFVQQRLRTLAFRGGLELGPELAPTTYDIAGYGAAFRTPLIVWRFWVGLDFDIFRSR